MFNTDPGIVLLADWLPFRAIDPQGQNLYKGWTQFNIEYKQACAAGYSY